MEFSTLDMKVFLLLQSTYHCQQNYVTWVPLFLEKFCSLKLQIGTFNKTFQMELPINKLN